MTPGSSAPFIDRLDYSTRESYLDGYTAQPCYPIVLKSPDEYIYKDKQVLNRKSGRCDTFWASRTDSTAVVSKRLAMMNSFATNDSQLPVSTIVRYLEASRLSLRALALTFNILANYRVDTPFTVLKRQDSHQGPELSTVKNAPAQGATDLVFIAALRLAAGYWEERPMAASWWAGTVTKHTFGSDDIGIVSMDMYSSVGWRIPIFAMPDAIEGALGVSKTHRSMSLPDVKAVMKARAGEMLTPPAEDDSVLTTRESYF
ncbi:hypothetical protein ANO11243_024180 [Dothideomycetidae sp. 11243]|nr:hypothetical protein ANO11243_024180 [fungal sp. No.11243]